MIFELTVYSWGCNHVTLGFHKTANYPSDDKDDDTDETVYIIDGIKRTISLVEI